METAVMDRPTIEDMSELTELAPYIQKKSSVFLTKLAQIGTHMTDILGNNMGYQVIKQIDTKMVKESGLAREGATFTGKGLCDLASFALQEGLSQKLPDHFSLRVVSVLTDMNGENWKFDTRHNTDMEHYILEAHDHNTGNKSYYDPTYGQVHADLSGQIIAIAPEELEKRYKRMHGTIEVKDVMARKEEVITALKKYGLTNDDYTTLVETVL